MAALLLVACTAQKRVPADQARLGRHLPPGSVAGAARVWNAVLASATQRVPIRELYKGAGWTIALDLEREALLRGGSISVISAGLGLACLGDVAPGYDITLTPGAPDSAPGCETGEGRAAWWSAIGGPAMLAERVADGRFDQVVVAVSASYLDAIVIALLAVSASLGVDGVTVFCTRPSAFAARLVGHLIVPVEPARTRALGGTVANAAPVALLHALRTLPRNNRLTRDALARTVAALPAAVELYPRREALGSEHAEGWLSDELRGVTPPASASAALRRYRAAGFAYEQKAFHRLFAEFRSGLAGAASIGGRR